MTARRVAPHRSLVLLPMPRRLLYGDGECRVSGAAGRADVRVDPASVPQVQGYELTIDAAGVRIAAHDEAGAFYGRQTLGQIVRQTPEGKPLPCLRITDWPDFANRGVMLDISRDKVPTMATIEALVDLLASWKVNQFQLYTEHTFAYPGHEVVWRDASPMTAEEIRHLDAYAKERFVELVPNQNSFGHLHRWLKHAAYRGLAETAEAIEHPFTPGVKEPFSLCPTDPQAVRFLEGLYDALLPNFSSRLFNVGCDETFDIGMGRSAGECVARGKGRVYLDFLLEIRRLAAAHGRQTMFWADIIHHHPELMAELPKDMIPLEWGYGEYHPFEARCARLAEAGLDFYVCPGTSSWNSFVGNTANAVGNIRAASHLGRRAGAIGLLNTDWGDNGHLQPLPVSYLGFACGAAMSWAYAANQTLDLPAALDLLAFGDRSGVMGRLAWDLGNTYLHAQAPLFDMVIHPEWPRSHKRLESLTVEGLTAALEHVRRTMAALDRADMQIADAALVAEEFRFASSLVVHACNLGLARCEGSGERVADLAAPVRRRLAEELEPIVAAYRRVWLARNREGGRADSVRRLERLLSAYTAGR